MKSVTLKPKPSDVPQRATTTFDDPAWQEKANQAYSVLYSLGIVLDQYLGCGSYGCAFQQRPMIVKLTEDSSEAANAKTMSKLACPGVARIYAVLAFESVRGMYAIFMEPLQPLTYKEKFFVYDPVGESGPDNVWPDRVDSLADELHRKRITQEHHDTRIAFIRQRARKVLGKAGAASYDSLIAGINCLYANGIYYTDGHQDNVLARLDEKGKREFVYFDLGHSVGPAVRITVVDPPTEQLRNAPVEMGSELGTAIGQKLLDEFTFHLDKKRRKPVQLQPIEPLYVGDTVMPEKAIFYRLAAQEGLDARKAKVTDDAHVSYEDGEVWVQTWFWLEGTGTAEQFRQAAFDAYAVPDTARVDMQAQVSQVPGHGAWVEGWTHVTQDAPPSRAPVELLAIPYSVQGGDLEEYLRVPEYIPRTARRAATALYALPHKRFPIGDLFHARLALIYAMSPMHAKVRDQVLAAVERAYPQYEWRAWMQQAAKLAGQAVEALPFDERKRVDYGRFPTVAAQETWEGDDGGWGPTWPLHDEVEPDLSW